MSEDLDSLLALTLTPGLGPTLTLRCLKAMGSAAGVLDSSTRDLASVEGIGAHRADAIRRAMNSVASDGAVQKEKELIAQHGVTLLAIDDTDYPPLLKLIHDPPPLLYLRGELAESDRLSLAVVGSRQCTNYGREQTDRIVTILAQSGLTITSGGALGIDAAAHRAALRVTAARTIAVLGSGLADPYPPDHRELFDQIAGVGAVEPRGALLSEFPMAAPPIPENFPRRNRIISGLSLGVLVVEAASRSGALITARLAAEEHHREVLALPGRADSPTSAGCHKIIREGWATLVTSAADVLDALGEAGEILKAPMIADSQPSANPDHSPLFTQNLTDSQTKVLASLDQPLTLDQIAAATSLPIHQINADLTLLQIRSLIAKDGAKISRRRS